MVDLNKQLITQTVHTTKPNSSMVDTRGIGRPGTFKGEESKFIEWMAKLNAYIRASYPGAPKWLNTVCQEHEKIDDESIKEMMEGKPEEELQLRDFSAKLYVILITCIEGYAF